MNKKRCKWIQEITEIPLFQENQSKSIKVPRDSKKVSAKMNEIVTKIIEK